jgi:hypothetical protein
VIKPSVLPPVRFAIRFSANCNPECPERPSDGAAKDPILHFRLNQEIEALINKESLMFAQYLKIGRLTLRLGLGLR